jgi:hypothetical protein
LRCFSITSSSKLIVCCNGRGWVFEIELSVYGKEGGVVRRKKGESRNRNAICFSEHQSIAIG